MDTKELKDEELLILARTEGGAALDLLFARYKPLVSKISRRYFLAGYEQDDLIQEGMIGLYKAYQSFRLGGDFRSFSILCVNRQIQSAIKSANRKKNKLLTESLSLNGQGGLSLGEGTDGEIVLILPSLMQSPEDELISLEKVKEMKKIILERLSKLEKEVLALYLSGLSYREISEKAGRSEKSIDNTLSRIKIKLKDLKDFKVSD